MALGNLTWHLRPFISQYEMPFGHEKIAFWALGKLNLFRPGLIPETEIVTRQGVPEVAFQVRIHASRMRKYAKSKIFLGLYQENCSRLSTSTSWYCWWSCRCHPIFGMWEGQVYHRSYPSCGWRWYRWLIMDAFCVVDLILKVGVLFPFAYPWQMTLSHAFLLAHTKHSTKPYFSNVAALLYPK